MRLALLAGALALLAATAHRSGAAAPACPAAGAGTAYTGRTLGALRATRDVWGNRLLAAPGGPTYDAARRYLKPLLLVADREIKSVDRVRTRSRAIPRMVEFFRTEMPVETLAVMHAQAPDEAEEIASELRRELPDLDVPIGQIGCVLGTHTGPKALGLVYLKA